MRIWSIGHSTHALEDFVALLSAHGVSRLVDVRTVPRSRRHPHFASEALARELPGFGIEYQHLAALGGWRRAAPDSVNAGWRNVSFRGYADYALTDEFAAGLEELREGAGRAPTAMMCSEGLWWRCHRRLVADRLVLAGDEVLHIGPDGRTAAHSLTEFARVEDGRLIYPV
jgi:uncharacterized protein (DUF488 family)